MTPASLLMPYETRCYLCVDLPTFIPEMPIYTWAKDITNMLPEVIADIIEQWLKRGKEHYLKWV